MEVLEHSEAESDDRHLNQRLANNLDKGRDIWIMLTKLRQI
jgi:hypothetical protein